MYKLKSIEVKQPNPDYNGEVNHHDLELNMLNKVNGITIMDFLILTKNIESCDKTRPDLKKQLIDLKIEAKEVLRKFEGGEDQPENSISLIYDKIQQYKKYF